MSHHPTNGMPAPGNPGQPSGSRPRNRLWLLLGAGLALVVVVGLVLVFVLGGDGDEADDAADTSSDAAADASTEESGAEDPAESDDGSAESPADAADAPSEKEFCDVWLGFLLDDNTGDPIDQQVQDLRRFGRDLESLGAPASMPEEARAGFDIFVDNSLNAEASDVEGSGPDDTSESDRAKVADYLDYANTTCAQ